VVTPSISDREAGAQVRRLIDTQPEPWLLAGRDRQQAAEAEARSAVPLDPRSTSVRWSFYERIDCNSMLCCPNSKQSSHRGLQTMNRCFVQDSAVGENISNIPGESVTICITGEQTGGGYSVTESERTAESKPTSAQIHTRETVMMQVHEGCLTIELDGHKMAASTGSLIHVPYGVALRFWNAGPDKVRYQTIFIPAGHENYLRDVHSLDATSNDHSERLIEIRKRYGLIDASPNSSLKDIHEYPRPLEWTEDRIKRWG